MINNMHFKGLFRDVNPIFVILFTFFTKYVFRVAVSEEEGGRRLAYMISDPSLEGVSGKYYTGRPGKPEFYATDTSEEAKDEKKAKLFYDLSLKLVCQK